MSFDGGLIDWVADGLTPIGNVTKRAMMGGATLYLDGTVFAIISQDQLWLKGDTASDAVWDAEGCEKFTYQFPNGKRGSMNYRRAPDDVYDDVEALIRWSRLALEAGMRGTTKKRKR